MNAAAKWQYPNRTGLVLLLAVLGFAARAAALALNPDNVLPDDLGNAGWEKISVALCWIRTPFSPRLTIYGPLHTEIISLFWLLCRTHTVWLARITNFVFSLALLPVFYRSVLAVFDSRRTALIALGLACIFPADILCSTVPVPENIAFFLLFGAVFTMHGYIREGKSRFFIESALCINFACMLRYELWPCGFFLAAWLYRRQRLSRGARAPIAYCLLSSAFIIYWMQRSMNITKSNPLASFNEAAVLTNTLIRDIPAATLMKLTLSEIVKSMSAPIALLAPAGLVLPLFRRRGRNVIWAMALFYTANLMIQPLLKIYHPHNLRHIYLPGLLLLPCGAYALEQAFARLPARLRRPRARALLSMALGLVFVASAALTTNARLYNMRHVVPLDIRRATEWLHENITPDMNRRIVLELGGFSFYVVGRSLLHPFQYKYHNSAENKQKTPPAQLEDMLEHSTHVFTCAQELLYKRIISERLFPHLVFREVIRIGEWIVFEINRRGQNAPARNTG